MTAVLQDDLQAHLLELHEPLVMPLGHSRVGGTCCENNMSGQALQI